MNVVCIGAGAGLPLLLRGLAGFARRQPADAGDEAIFTTAIVFPADDGAAPGEVPVASVLPGAAAIRDCLAALSRASLLGDIFRHRLALESNAAQHCLGDLILAALVSRNASLAEAAHMASSLLQCAGRVIPVTESATLCAEFEDGRQARGGTEINAARQAIRRAWLDPLHPAASPGVIQSILDADSVVLGPGSLFTGVVSNLLTAGICEALRESPAVKILVVNLFNEAGQTAGLPASGHLRILEEHLGRGTINVCLINSRPVPARLLQELALQGCTSVEADMSNLVELGSVPILADLLRETSAAVEYDSAKLARSVVALTQGSIRAREIASGGIARNGPKEASAGSPET